MVISDHSAPLTDLTFSPDDSAIFTGSSDGAVYRHTLFANQRDGEVRMCVCACVRISVCVCMYDE